MNMTKSQVIQEEFKEKMDYEELLNCMRCGFCLPSCPTYIETNQDEAHSPRGRIALMKGVVDGNIEPDEDVKHSLDMCLGCRACEPVCPSGVKYGHLLEQARDIIYQNKKQSFPVRTLRSVVFKGLFPHHNRMIAMTGLLRLYQRFGIQAAAQKSGLLGKLPETLQTMEKILPAAPKRTEMTSRPSHLFPVSKPKKRVAFFSGCLMDTMFMETNNATMKLLQHAGCEIIIPQTQNCCGALHGHGGEKNQAKQLAKKNILAFEEQQVDYIITNAGGCGAFLVDYDHLLSEEPYWKERAEKFCSKIKDITAILVELGFHHHPLQLEEQILTYQDSCHLKNGQKTYLEPRRLLMSIKGSEYREMKDADRCCGSAGIYNIVEPDMSMQILDHKMEQVKSTKAHTIVTSNPGCLLQIKIGIEREGLSDSVRAIHIVDLLLEAYEAALSEQVN